VLAYLVAAIPSHQTSHTALLIFTVTIPRTSLRGAVGGVTISANKSISLGNVGLHEIAGQNLPPAGAQASNSKPIMEPLIAYILVSPVSSRHVS